MSPEFASFLVFCGGSVLGIVVNGILCQRGGYAAGLKDGLAQGHADGWRDAHDRVAAALRIPPENLILALLEIELTKTPPSNETAAGAAMVALHQRSQAARAAAAADREHQSAWGATAFR